ncbi:MAG: mannose-6-phosphate isomerase-like protein (cupin superfamily) [Planctomycetota bacterium]|jgi:mannose-6-phosphate isomerase-like protein (cupin superfamily)
MSAPKTINIAEKFAQVQDQWTPHRIATFDDHQIFLARVEGDFVWHDHADHAEVFLPIKGVLLIDFEDGSVARVAAGEVLVVPAGVKHRPRTEDGECQLLVLDPLVTKHTGDVKCDRTVEEFRVI